GIGRETYEGGGRRRDAQGGLREPRGAEAGARGGRGGGCRDGVARPAQARPSDVRAGQGARGVRARRREAGGGITRGRRRSD
ncbi:MAG: hypothetical protein AVDCRST_MAG12-144, partial [uncultured Rubrobacteraceae bacterium]